MKKLMFALMLASLSFIAVQEASAVKLPPKKSREDKNKADIRKPCKRQLFREDDRNPQRDDQNRQREVQNFFHRWGVGAQPRDEDQN